MYVTTLENETEITLYCIDGQSDIPYIDMETAMHLLVMVQRYAGDEDYELTMETNGAVVYFTRENGSRVGIDFANGAIGWEDYNMFTAKSYAVNSLDILGSSGLDEDGEAYLFRRSTSSFVRRGQPVGLEFADFFIELAFEDGKGYMPLQTFSDLFLAYCYFNIAYNGEAVFLVCSSDLGDMREAYYSVEPKPRSEALARFNYVEMCLSLQFNYGLKDQHDIPSFGTLFELTGMQDRLQSADALEANGRPERRNQRLHRRSAQQFSLCLSLRGRRRGRSHGGVGFHAAPDRARPAVGAGHDGCHADGNEVLPGGRKHGLRLV